MLAASTGHQDIVEFLYESRGADVNAQDTRGWTALLLAVRGGYLPTVQCLHARGADIDPCTSLGMTSLMVAAKNGHMDIVQYLTKMGANINKCNHNGVTALMLASSWGHQDKCCRPSIGEVVPQKAPTTSLYLVS